MTLPVTRTVTLPAPSHSAYELQTLLNAYKERARVPTWAGTAAYLGIPRALLDAMHDGRIDAPEQDKADYQGLLARFKTFIEAYLEETLTREKGSPAGAIFALRAKFDWRDVISVEIGERPTLAVSVGEELGRLLNGDFEDVTPAADPYDFLD